MITQQELSAAHAALETLAKLGLKNRVEKAKNVITQCRAIEAELSEHTYAVDQLFAVTGGANFSDARRVLEQLSEGLLRKYYPPVTQSGGLHGEDKILADLLPGIDGWYVDIGAWRPEEQSNTWQFYKKGWRGVLVEPVPAHWGALLHQRLGDFLVPFAVSNKSGLRRMRVSGPTSSFHGAAGDEHGDEEIIVETRTLAEVLKGFPDDVSRRCRLCSVDVEGHEQEVLEGIDWKTFLPEVFCIEYKDHLDGSDTSKRWSKLVLDRGYAEVARTENNVIYSRRHQTDELARPEVVLRESGQSARPQEACGGAVCQARAEGDAGTGVPFK